MEPKENLMFKNHNFDAKKSIINLSSYRVLKFDNFNENSKIEFN